MRIIDKKIKFFRGEYKKTYAKAIGSSGTHNRVQRNIRYISFLMEFFAYVIRVLPKLYLRSRETPMSREHALGVSECVIAQKQVFAILHRA